MVHASCLEKPCKSLTLDTVIEENGVRLRLNIVDTPGYGDQVNNDRWYARILVFGKRGF